MVDSCKFTPFGLWVKTELLRRGKSQRWLEEEICGRYQLYADSGYLYKVFTGQRRAPRVVRAIWEILALQQRSGA